MGLRDVGVTIWTYIRSNIVRVVVAIAVIVAAVLVWQPLEQVQDPTGDDISIAWNQSIGRLGITPVYPPTEDLAVGDVWAVIAQSEATPLLGKAVRIGHIDLRNQILAASKQPIFADTAELVSGASYAKQDRYEVEPAAEMANRIPLALTAFPGITITHTLRSGVDAGEGSGWFGVRRARDQQEDIRIGAAQTYGVQTVDAILILNNWCKAKQTAVLCQDSTVRTILSYAVGEQVLETKDNKYTNRLGLQLVTRVFLMREIEQRRANDLAKGAGLQIAGAQQADPQPGAAAAGDGAATGSAALADGVGKALNQKGGTGVRTSMIASDGTTVYLKQTFQRPIVFGYRAVTTTIEPSTPAGNVP